jgi:hypothetical protein
LNYSIEASRGFGVQVASAEARYFVLASSVPRRCGVLHITITTSSRKSQNSGQINRSRARKGKEDKADRLYLL